MPTTPVKEKAVFDGPSPLKAMDGTPIDDKTLTHYYRQPVNKEYKDKLQSPGGTIVPRDPSEYHGRNHKFATRSDGSRYKAEDFDVVATDEERWDCLVLDLINLKRRTDSDYKHFQRYTYDYNHHYYTIDNIDKIIGKIKYFLESGNLNKDVLHELNKLLRKGQIYNPFGLRRIYKYDGTYCNWSADNPSVYTQNIFPWGFTKVSAYTIPGAQSSSSSAAAPAISVDTSFSMFTSPPNSLSSTTSSGSKRGVDTLFSPEHEATQEEPDSKKRSIEPNGL